MREIGGKAAVVVGGGSGIGRGVALGLADAGARLAIADIDLASAEAVAKEVEARGVRALALQVDGTSRESLAALAERAARELGVTWIREYAREYVERRGNDLTAADVEPIAKGQIANLDRATGALILLDTDLISTVVYARHYYGSCPAWIEDEARRRRADLYLLLDTDVAWQPDPARDAGGAAREVLFHAFRAALDEFETQWEIVSGDWEERWRRLRLAAATWVGIDGST